MATIFTRAENLMSTLYVDRKGMELRYADGVLQLRAQDQAPRSVPGRLLERVVLRAETKLTSTTLALLAEAGISVVAHGGRGGQHVAHVLGGHSSECRARVAQCQRLNDNEWAGAFAARIIRARMQGQRRVLVRAMDVRPDIRKPLFDAIRTIEGTLKAVAETNARSVLRGLEGAGAAAFFRGYTSLFAPSLGFNARRRRPPPDPVNACLSIGYTLLQSHAVKACWAAGLDPMVGFLHLPSYGRASLACDLVEPWRAHVEQWVLDAFRLGNLRLDHFGRDGAGACLVGKAARAFIYEASAPMQRRCSAGLHRHAKLLAKALASEAVLAEDAWETE
jgi:CRISPR-associated protein Cas1